MAVVAQPFRVAKNAELKPGATQVEDGLEGLSAAGNGETGYRVAVKPQGHPAKPVTVPIHVASDSSTLPMKVSA